MDGSASMQAMFISQKCASCCRSAVFQRSRSRRRLPPVYRLPPRGDLTWTIVETSTAIFFHRRREDSSFDHRRLFSGPGSARYFTPPLATVWSDLTIRLYSTTSLKSITLKWWLYHQMFKLTFQFCSTLGVFQWAFSGGSLAMHESPADRRYFSQWNTRRRFPGGSMVDRTPLHNYSRQPSFYRHFYQTYTE